MFDQRTASKIAKDLVQAQQPQLIPLVFVVKGLNSSPHGQTCSGYTFDDCNVIRPFPTILVLDTFEVAFGDTIDALIRRRRCRNSNFGYIIDL